MLLINAVDLLVVKGGNSCSFLKQKYKTQWFCWDQRTGPAVAAAAASAWCMPPQPGGQVSTPAHTHTNHPG